MLASCITRTDHLFKHTIRTAFSRTLHRCRTVDLELDLKYQQLFHPNDSGQNAPPHRHRANEPVAMHSRFDLTTRSGQHQPVESRSFSRA